MFSSSSVDSDSNSNSNNSRNSWEMGLVFRNQQIHNNVPPGCRSRLGFFKVPSLITLKIGESEIDESHWDHGVLDSADDFELCLELLESDMYEDNYCGIEKLVGIVSSELVNCKWSGSIAEVLVCGDIQNRKTDRLRKAFVSFLSEGSPSRDPLDSSDDSQSGSFSSCSGSEESTGRHSGALKLPALQILASSLELLSLSHQTCDSKLDLFCDFWKQILRSLSGPMEVIQSRRIEATLSLKCIRILRNLQPTVVEPYIRYSILPYLMHAHEFGVSNGDRNVVRESEAILNPMGVGC